MCKMKWLLLFLLLAIVPVSCGWDEQTESPEPAPTCRVTPSRLGFGVVQVGGTRDRVFTIKNTGRGILTGGVSEECACYSIQAGGGRYALAAGEERTVTVRFAPTSAGSYSCAVGLGETACGSVECSGEGMENLPACELTPSRLDFGSVQVGQTSLLLFTIRNTGSRTLTGSVTDSCTAFSIQAGGGSYSLEASQEKTVIVRFAPTTAGAQTCRLSLGATPCGLMTCEGIGTEQHPPGGNWGGVLVVHATTIEYSAGVATYMGQSGVACGQDLPLPPSRNVCPPYDPADGAIPCNPWAANPTLASAQAGKSYVWYVMAAFPETSCPRLKALAFRFDYDAAKVAIVASGCDPDAFTVSINSDRDEQEFPAPGSGVGITFPLATRTSLFQEIYWFAGYAYQEVVDATWQLRAKSSTDHYFVDDSAPPRKDQIQGFGRLGLGGTAGENPGPIMGRP